MYFVHDPARHLTAAERTFLDVAREVISSSTPQVT